MPQAMSRRKLTAKNVKSNIKARWIVSRKVAKHVLSKVEGGAKNKNFEARNLKFETISNDQNRNM